ncbi:MAG: exodeoxyribonuclease VII large subunit [Clostridia bacterium]|nr:exodeoxyribonuclease VII large subunit [Clostridia bacterium]
MYSSNILTVSGLNMYLKDLIDNDNNLKNIFIEGEISNFANHYSSGHIYLSLKDSKSVIKAVMFSFNAKRLRFVPCDGMKVICRGRIGIYEASGQYQLYIDDMQPDGAGALTIAFEQLKEKLSKQGLFDASRKKPIPRFPENIGVITSASGAAIEDIKNILSRRYPIANVLLCPTLVQGNGAAEQMVQAIDYFNCNSCVDVIIIGRGGGSMEDLWEFNDEKLAYAIADSKIPIVSAVGHETDFTICDFVADLRAPTPSAAAELVVPDRAELLSAIEYMNIRLKKSIESTINQKNDYLNNLKIKLSSFNAYDLVQKEEIKLDMFSERFNNSMRKIIDSKANILEIYTHKLETLSPLNVLKRGYSLTSGKNGTINSVKDVSSGDKIEITLSDGKINAIAE